MSATSVPVAGVPWEQIPQSSRMQVRDVAKGGVRVGEGLARRRGRRRGRCGIAVVGMSAWCKCVARRVAVMGMVWVSLVQVCAVRRVPASVPALQNNHIEKREERDDAVDGSPG